MLSSTVQITTPTNTMSDQVPADVYQIKLTDVVESEGTDFNTGEPRRQLKFAGVIVEGEYAGKIISFFTSTSWFNGGKNSKPSKLFNLAKTVYAFYQKGIKVNEIAVFSAEDVNGLIGKQIRVTTETNEKGWPKVTAFTPIKAEITFDKDEVDPSIEIPKL